MNLYRKNTLPPPPPHITSPPILAPPPPPTHLPSPYNNQAMKGRPAPAHPVGTRRVFRVHLDPAQYHMDATNHNK